MAPDTSALGSSLWLIPRESPFLKCASELITDTIPSNFSHTLPKHKFTPHITITGGIDPPKTYEASGTSAQEWLDGLTLPEFKKELDEVVVELDHLEAGEPFFRKLVIEISRNENLLKLVEACRRQAVVKPSQHDSNGMNGTNGDAGGEDAAQQWVKKEYAPHLSLYYGDISKDDVKKKIPLVELQLGYEIGSLFDCCGGGFCMGGVLALVDTRKPIDEWKPIATRETPWTFWKMSRNLC